MDVVSLGYRTDLMLRRMAGAAVTDQGSYLAVRTPANPGFWWGNFLLHPEPPLPGDARRWAERFAAEFPGAAHLAIGVDGTRGATGDPAELERLGVTVETLTVLTADRLAPPARPAPGAVLRPLAGDDDWAQAVELNLACAEGPTGPSAQANHRLFAERRTAEARALCEAGHGAWFGAFADGRLLAGAGLFGDGGGLARFQNVETHPDVRRRGLATHLVHHAGGWGLGAFGARATLVIVADPDPDHHAIGVYRALGFADAEQQVQLTRPPAPAVSTEPAVSAASERP
ncbi:GNAT family N-acetyltransferase [Actinacidiphila yeochonensis]|uniref:GNAT family N-acetyltransferase n=1 Tax=Actinacidiphila yeochonensis TaxID=89050 RepID=UPI000689482B|nr:GNAT family N-acetyltransferase [Actinacidiphila yeochonensis]